MAALRQTLLELGEAGASSGMAFAALKGAAWLVEDDRGSAAWREMIDLDVLVDPEQFDAVPALLQRLGYSPAGTAKRYRNNFHHAPYRHPSLPVTLEVHRHIGWQHRLLPSKILLADSGPAGRGLLLPAPWTRAFHAIIHWQIQDHGGSRGTLPLKDLLDVARFLQRSDVAWGAVRAHAQRVQAVEACRVAIAAAAMLLRAPAPREFAPDAAARRWVSRSVARRASPSRTWLATQLWRAGTLWRCEKVGYRCALLGLKPPVIAMAVWSARVLQLPLLAVRATGIAAAMLVRAGNPGARR